MDFISHYLEIPGVKKYFCILSKNVCYCREYFKGYRTGKKRNNASECDRSRGRGSSFNDGEKISRKISCFTSLNNNWFVWVEISHWNSCWHWHIFHLRRCRNPIQQQERQLPRGFRHSTQHLLPGQTGPGRAAPAVGAQVTWPTQQVTWPRLRVWTAAPAPGSILPGLHPRGEEPPTPALTLDPAQQTGENVPTPPQRWEEQEGKLCQVSWSPWDEAG